jgi:type IV pilus assembly protein PilA
MNPGAAPPIRRALDIFARNLPAVSQPLLSVRSNLPDGILVRSNWNKSLKANVAMFTIYNPVTVGLMAAMAIPAFQKVRANAQQKAAMNNSRLALPPQAPPSSQTEAITDNLRVLDEAADRYYAEHDTTTTTLDQLVGPDKYIPAIKPVAGEDYRTVLFKKGRPLRLFLRDGRMIMYPPPQ